MQSSYFVSLVAVRATGHVVDILIRSGSQNKILIDQPQRKLSNLVTFVKIHVQFHISELDLTMLVHSATFG